MIDLPQHPKFPAQQLQPEFIIHSADTFATLAESWLMGTGQILFHQKLESVTSPLNVLREIKHQARNAFQSKSFELTSYVKTAREAIRNIKKTVTPESKINIDIYNKNPIFYWHYSVLAHHVGNLAEAKDILENKAVPALHNDRKMMIKINDVLGTINEKLAFEANIGLHGQKAITPFVKTAESSPTQK